MTKQRRWQRPVGLVVLLVLAHYYASGCGSLGDLFSRALPDTRTETINALNDAISALQQQSADWQQVLKDTEAKLTDATQSTVRNEIANVLSRSVAQAGVELRCNADFVNERIREELVRIKAVFLNPPAPAVEPAFCQVVPVAVDRALVPDRLNRLEFYGYNFTQAPDLAVYLARDNGARVNVMNALNKPTHYAMTLNLGANGVPLDNSSAQFVLEWGGHQVSSIAVIQPPTPVCQSTVHKVASQTVGPFIPPKVGTGDNEFNGNGPDVTATVTLTTTPQALTARVYMHAKETRSDWTEVQGWHDFQLYAPGPGWKIDHLVETASSSFSYRDSNTAEDSFDLGAGEPVRRFVFVGDTPGDEAGTETSVRVTFNDLHVVLTQTANCVPERAVRSAHAAGLLAAQTFLRLNPAVVQERQQLNAVLRQMNLDRLITDQ